MRYLLVALVASLVGFGAGQYFPAGSVRTYIFACGFTKALGLGDTPECEAEFYNAGAHGFLLPKDPP